MRWLHLSLIAFAMAFVVGLPTAEARTTVSRTTSIDPVTGVRTTQVVKERNDRGWHRGWRNRNRRAFRANTVIGAPIVAQRGFPRHPRDGERVWRAGRLWEFERSLGRWIIVR